MYNKAMEAEGEDVVGLVNLARCIFKFTPNPEPTTRNSQPSTLHPKP